MVRPLQEAGSRVRSLRRALLQRVAESGYHHACSDSLVVAEVNADEEVELGAKYEIRGYPTIKLFPAGNPANPIDFKGDRTKEGLTEWTNKQIGTRVIIKGPPTSVKRVVPETLDALIQEKPYVFLKLYAPWCGHCKALAPVYSQLANLFAEEENVPSRDAPSRIGGDCGTQRRSLPRGQHSLHDPRLPDAHRRI